MTRLVMDTKQRIGLHMKMQAVLVTRTDGFVEYIEGYSDKKLGEEFSASEKAVQNHRITMFGKLFVGSDNVSTELARVKKHLNDLCCSLGYARLD